MVALFVILFVVVLLTIDLVVQARQKKYPLMARTPRHIDARAAHLVRMPGDVFFHPAHSWTRMSGKDRMVVGIDDFVQKAIGVIENVHVPQPGQKVRQGDPVISVQHGGRKLTMVAPVTGTVVSVNRDVLDNPALIAENPYDDGWLFMIEPEQIASNLSLLSVAEDAVSWIRKEALRFREFLTANAMQPALVGETMLDGGIPVQGSLEFLDENGVKNFEQEFLR